jgi:translocation and assembly module TamA
MIFTQWLRHRVFSRFVESRERSISLFVLGSGRKTGIHVSWNRSIAPVLALLLAVSPARAADPQAYRVEISGAPSGDITDTLRATAQLLTLQAKGEVPPFALIERARSDIPRLQTALDSYGYYLNSVTITIAARGLDDPDLPATLDAIPAGTAAVVTIAVAMGPLYHIGALRLTGTVPDSARAALALKSGDPAVAARVLEARSRMLGALQEDGYPLAVIEEPDANADDSTHTLDIGFNVQPGAQAPIGEISFKGLRDVNASFARRALIIHPGEPYRPSRIEQARQALAALGVFSGVSVRAADRLSADGRIPLTFDVEERLQHAVTISGTYSTDLGVNLATTWSHRNLFGNAEQLNLTAAGSGLGNAAAGISYNLTAQYIQPLFLLPNQTLEFNISSVKQQLSAYDQTAQTIAGYLRRKFSRLWTGSIGLSLTHDDTQQEGISRLYQLVALPVTGTYDSTGIEGLLADPVTGLRASLAMTPTHAFGGNGVTFLVSQASASTYFDLAGDGRSVLALRALAGNIFGGSNLDVPPDQRLYAGGSATVRGYAYQSIGPQFADGRPVGAKSVDAATIEFRQRIGADWGAAAFVDAGQASANGAPFTGKLHVGAGLGARYYTPIGALRLDVGVPLTQVPRNDSFQIYIGLGQAF